MLSFLLCSFCSVVCWWAVSLSTETWTPALNIAINVLAWYQWGLAAVYGRERAIAEWKLEAAEGELRHYTHELEERFAHLARRPPWKVLN